MEERNEILCVVREVTMTYGAERELPATIASSRDVIAFARGLLGKRVTESFLVIAIDSRQRPVGWSEVARGSTSACPVAPADVYRFAVHVAASAVILVHNHPSGDPFPSAEDVSLTERLVKGGDLLGIKVLDHVIATRSLSFSFLDAGLLR